MNATETNIETLTARIEAMEYAKSVVFPTSVELDELDELRANLAELQSAMTIEQFEAEYVARGFKTAETVHIIEATPKHGHERDHTVGCQLHGTKCCNVCCVHEGQCDFGGCHNDAVTHVDTTLDGRVVERRPACSKHANHGNYGVGYVMFTSA